MPANRAATKFGSDPRFVLEAELGRGSMGVVYRARDRESAVPVALKTMTHIEPSALLRFKNEFRALADISHPNVVQLYDMVSEGDQWFFTMELLDGVDFLRWVRHGSVCDCERLRSALQQLASGVLAIHAAGKLHRDIKPSNVQVTSDGRVVLLDFGVVGDIVPNSDRSPSDDPILGTPAYMAPERARGLPADMASDWYAVGVMMYEALTGQLPFAGRPRDILFGGRGLHPPPPSALVDGVSTELDGLCLELLQGDPKLRPLGAEILARLLPREAGARRSTPAGLGVRSVRPFVGRKSELESLAAAFAESALGKPVVALVAGRSGMGKTVLTQRFLSRVAESPGTVVLAGRCFEREALPFKGMDSVVDELSRYLIRHEWSPGAQALPPGLHYLARVFPVLSAVPGFAHLTQPEHEIAEPIELRKRAFAALKALLATLARTNRLVVHIDDVQWSDIDSLLLLEELLRAPNAPALLLLFSFREEVRATSPVLQELGAMLKRVAAGVEVRELSVEQLPPAESVELARLSLAFGGLSGEDANTPQLARAIAQESQGVPIFVSELAEWQLERQSQSGSDAQPSLGVSLEQVIQKRVAELPAEARALLRALAVANGPLPYGVAEQTAGVGRNDALRARLRAARLVRTFRADGQDLVETYHARVGDSVVATLSATERRGVHGALARALEASGAADPEALVEQYLGAGEVAQARRHVLAAALAAENGLAFMRAVRLYRLALELGVEHPRHELLARVGDALVNAGRSAEAADAYHEAALVAPSEHAVELARRAAEHYLKGGRDRDGLSELRAVLARVGMGYPESAAAALGSLLYHRARLQLRGLEFEQVSAEDCAAKDLIRVDVAFAATAGLVMVDVVRGADFGAQQLHLALDVGEPIRICRALAFEAGNVAAVGAASRERIDRLVRTAEALARSSRDPHSSALAKVASGLVHAFSGEWRAAQRQLDEAEVILRERCRAATWELTNVQAWSQNSRILCGDLPAATARMPALMREAAERSDRYAVMHLIYPACITALAANEIDTAWRVATDDSSFRSCAPGRFTAGHWGRLISIQSVYRYRGEGMRARRFVHEQWRALTASRFLRVQLMRVFSEFERALSALAALDEGETDRDVVREAARSVERVTRDRPSYALPMGQYLAGCLAAAQGDRPRALGYFELAAPGLARAEMGYLALCARQRCADLLGGDSGRELDQRCRADFASLGVVDRAACLTMSAPGFRRFFG
ncbi:MAG TPA: protein kinase [Polyangiaceae bacterium]|nr:protein kinase [Polyangiaceae bacterium]